MLNVRQISFLVKGTFSLPKAQQKDLGDIQAKINGLILHFDLPQSVSDCQSQISQFFGSSLPQLVGCPILFYDKSNNPDAVPLLVQVDLNYARFLVCGEIGYGIAQLLIILHEYGATSAANRFARTKRSQTVS